MIQATIRQVAVLYTLSFGACAATTVAQTPDERAPIASMSYNIRLATDADGADRWELRKSDLVALVEHYAPHFLGLQEALPQQVDYLDSMLLRHLYIGVGRDDGARGGEFSAIFYDTTRFRLLSGSTFWLSQKPETPSRGWDAALPRVCTHGSFADRRTGDTIYVFNTHFDHVGDTARLRSADLIAQVIGKVCPTNASMILMGDFNLKPESAAIQKLSQQFDDSRKSSIRPAYGPEGTFNGFLLDQWPRARIDYVFVRGLRVAKQSHLDDRRPGIGRWVSDHLPVLVEVW